MGAVDVVGLGIGRGMGGGMDILVFRGKRGWMVLFISIKYHMVKIINIILLLKNTKIKIRTKICN